MLGHTRGDTGIYRSTLMKNSCSRYSTGNETLFVGLDGCEVRLCGPCAFVRPRVPCVSCVCPGSPRCIFTRYR